MARTADSTQPRQRWQLLFSRSEPALRMRQATLVEELERGAAAAFFTMLDWLALLVAGPVVGYLIERTGYGATFMSLALVIAMGIAVFYSLDRRGRSAEP